MVDSSKSPQAIKVLHPLGVVKLEEDLFRGDAVAYKNTTECVFAEKTAGSTPTSQTPKQQGAHAEKQREKPKEKEDKKEVDMGENILAKPVDNAPMKEEKQKEPLHIEVPPPRILKAKRTMKEVRSARDPEYRTLELDMKRAENSPANSDVLTGGRVV
ncbi:hypothetical protein RB195_015555 [Necator americanus]|uniref:Uncharacterized protein n=1 Tax=Necator americanus TaxID=51031 RepID=A0ABR1E711_NECAM